MYKITKNDNDVSHGVKEFVCDAVNDIQSLPACEMGSKVLVIENSTTYIKNGAGYWVVLATNGNNSGSSSTPTFPGNKVIYEGGVI
jgi:hypothetical protein